MKVNWLSSSVDIDEIDKTKWKEAVFKNFHMEKSNYADFDAKIKDNTVIKIRLCPKLA